MAKTNQAKNLADVPNPNEDPISELSDIMKFDPVEAAIEEADATLEIDLENELMGDLSVVEDEPVPPAEPVPASEAGLTGIPGLDDPVEIADPVEAAQDDAAPVADEAAPADDDIDGAFDAVFDESLEDVEVDDDAVIAEPTVPQELENQLNDLLAGLGGKDEAPEVEAVSADESDVQTEAPISNEVSDDVLPEIAISDDELDVPLDTPETEMLVEDDAAAVEAHDSAESGHEPDPLETLIGITANLDKQVSPTESAETDASAAPEPTESEVSETPDIQSAAAEMSDPAPLVETADIVDEAVPLDDDLDIPDVAFENDVPKAPDFEDLDEEFTKAFSKLTDFDNVKDEQSSSESATVSEEIAIEAAEDAEPHLGEKLDDIFAEMSEKIAPAAAASQIGSAAMGGTAGEAPQWAGTAKNDVDEPFMSSPPPPIGSDVDPAAAQGGGGDTKRGILIAAIVAAIAVAGGVGAFALSFGGGDDTQAPALVKADDGPVKVKPKDPGGKTVPNEDKKVYERVAGTGEDETLTQEKLISTAEEPVNVVAEQQAEVAVNDAEPRVVLPDPSAGASDSEVVAAEKPADAVPAEKNDDRILPEIERTAGAPAEELVAVKPRRVKTLIVRPDGTLVPREDPVAEVTNELRTGSAEETQAAEIAAAPAAEATPEPAPQPVETAAAAEETNREVTFQAPAADEPVVVDGASEPVNEGVVVEGIPFPTPAPRAEFEAQRVAAAEARQPEPAASELQPAETNAEPEVAAADPAPAAAATPEWWVQISSQPSRESAQASYAELANRHGSIIGGRGVNIVRAEIEGKGTYYRVRVAGGSRSEAAQLCSRLKSAGAGCFIAR